MATTSVGSVFIDLLVGNTPKFLKAVKSAGNTAANSLTGTFKGAFTTIGKLAATAISAKAITAFVSDCVEAASDLAEVQNVVDVTFGNSTEIINSWAKSASKSYGLSELSAKQYTGTMGAMLKSMKLNDSAVLDMSMNIASLAGDMASFYNLDTDTAFEKIRSGISGETEPLKQLGINLSVTNLEAYRMSQGIETAYSKMSQADQAILRYNYLLSVTSDAQGDFARTSSGWANQTRVLTLNIETLKSTLGGLAIQALTPIIQKLNAIIEYAISAANALTKLLGGTVKTSSATSSGMSGVSSSAIQAADDITDTQKTAQTAAKKINASFADIDEIHILGNKNDTSDSDSSSTSGTQTLTPDISYSTSGASALDVDGDIEKLKKIGKITGLALMGLGVVLTLLGHPALGIAMIAAGTAITAASIMGGESLTNDITSVLSVIAVAVGGAMIAVGAILCLTGANIPIGIALLAGGATTIVSGVTANWTGMSEKTKSVLTIITAAVSAALLAIGAIITLTTMTHLPLGIALMAAGAVGLVSSIALNWNGMSDKTKKVLSAITAIVGGALLALGIIICVGGTHIPLGIALLVAGAASIATSVALNWNAMETKTGGMLQKIAAIAGGALLALGVILCAAQVSFPLGLALMAAGGASLAAAVNIDWDMVGKKVKGAWGKIETWFNSKVKPVFTVDWWKNKLSAIPNAGKSVINTLLGIFERGLNWIINKINGLSFKVPDWVPSIGGKKFGFSIPTVSLPRLAQGGYVKADNPQLAIVGDNKREGEIISPESKIREQVELALSKAGGAINDIQQLYSIIKQAIKEAFSELQFATGGDWHIVITDESGSVKAEQIISAAERKNRRDGRTVIRIGG